MNLLNLSTRTIFWMIKNNILISTLISVLILGRVSVADIGFENDRSENNDSNDDKKLYKIAIIGSGIGGASAAYFLDELLQRKAPNLDYEIDIYEQLSRVGGRLATINMDGKYYEAGGSIIHVRNKYATDLAKKFDLEHKVDNSDDNEAAKSENNANEDDDRLCIYNGKQFVFCESQYKPITYFTLWYRYGFYPIRLQNRVSKILDYFERIYKLQEAEHVYDQVADLLEAMNPMLNKLTKLSFRELLRDHYDLSDRFIEELVQAVTLVNYGQTVTIPSFVGMVSYAGAGSGLWSIKGGNKLLPLNLVDYSDARILLNTKVTSITYLGDHQFKVESINMNDNQSTGNSTTSNINNDSIYQSSIYDYVIIATPLTVNSDIRFENFTKRNDLLNSIFDRYQMHQTFATFIKGTVLEKYKDLSILSCNIDQDHTGSFFTSMSPLTPVDTKVDTGNDSEQQQSNFENSNELPPPNLNRKIYKIFSNSSLKIHDLYSLFEEIDDIKEIAWNAYPEYSRVSQPMPPFKIRSGMYYLNAIEWAASAMEMSLIGGKNMALLVCHDLNLCEAEKDFNNGNDLEDHEHRGGGKRGGASSGDNHNKRQKVNSEL